MTGGGGIVLWGIGAGWLFVVMVVVGICRTASVNRDDRRGDATRGDAARGDALSLRVAPRAPHPPPTGSCASPAPQQWG